ncbi:MAG: hypothetical protein AAFY72_01860 [Cyanobacteria bacterium J06649_4]
MVPVVKSKSKANPTVKVRNRLTFKKILYHPLTWIAVGAHVVLLFVPFNPNKPTAVEEVPEEEIDESIPVDILNLSSISTPTPPPEAAPKPPDASPPPAAALPPAPVPAPSPTPVPAPADEEAAPMAEVADPVEQTVSTESPVETEQPQQPAYDPSGDQQVFISNLGNLRGVNAYDATLLPYESDFPNGNGAFFLDFSSDPPGPAAGALNATRIDKQPSSALEVVTSSYSSAGYTVAPLANYANEALYELKTAEGATALYMSLVSLEGSTLVVTWPNDPNL